MPGTGTGRRARAGVRLLLARLAEGLTWYGRAFGPHPWYRQSSSRPESAPDADPWRWPWPWFWF